MASNPPIVKSPNTCWRYAQGAYCPEELCHYQHGPPLSVSRLPRRNANSYGRTACLFFAKGHCKYGESCSFAHIPLSDGKEPSPVSWSKRDGQKRPLINFSSPFPQAEAPTSSRSTNAQSRPELSIGTGPGAYPSRRPDDASSVATPSSRNLDYSPSWSGHGEVDSGGSASEGDRPHGDRSRLQVYDDRKVLVLSGGVMLGTGSQGSSSPTSPRDLRRARSTQLPTSPSSSSMYSSDYLATPIDWSNASPASALSWADDQASSVPISPASFAGAPSPFTHNTFRFPPQTTTITITHAPNPPPPSSSQNKRNRSHRGPRPDAAPMTMDHLSASLSNLSVAPSTPRPTGSSRQIVDTPMQQTRSEISYDDEDEEDWDKMPAATFPPPPGSLYSLTRASTPLPHDEPERRRSSIGVLAEQQEYTRERERLRGYSKLRQAEGDEDAQSRASSSRRESSSTHKRGPSM